MLPVLDQHLRADAPTVALAFVAAAAAGPGTCAAVPSGRGWARPGGVAARSVRSWDAS